MLIWNIWKRFYSKLQKKELIGNYIERYKGLLKSITDSEILKKYFERIRNKAIIEKL